MHHANLVRRFAEAGLTLSLASRPIVGGLSGRGASSIVQIDIQRKSNGSRRHEWFRIFPGAEENRIEVVGLDKSIGQVVVMVHEPPREFFEPLPVWSFRGVDLTQPDWKEALAKKAFVQPKDVFASFGGGHRLANISVRRRTPGDKRHMLMGLDERQLFIAQLRKGCSTVREAHASLKTTELVLAEGKMGEATRQGEFFFVQSSESERARIEMGIANNLLVIEHTVPIGPFSVAGALRGASKVRQFRGNPHTADELIIVLGDPVPGIRWAVRSRELFIRGRVRHVDHKTVKFSQWVKVILNNEANAGQALGVGWVD